MLAVRNKAAVNTGVRGLGGSKFLWCWVPMTTGAPPTYVCFLVR